MAADKPITLAHLLRGKDGVSHAMDTLEWPAGTTRELRRAIRMELESAAQKGLRFERSQGSKNKKSLKVAAQVKALVKANQTATHEELYQLAHERKVIPADMPRDTFKRYVTATMRELGIRRRPGRRPK